MDEIVYLKTEHAEITSTKMVINGATYATRNVASVRMDEVPMGNGPTYLMILAFVMLFFTWILAVPLMIISLWMMFSRASQAALILMVGGGEVVALKDADMTRLKPIHDAVVLAISSR